MRSLSTVLPVVIASLVVSTLACGVDPFAGQEIPKVGSVYTGSFSGVEDIYSSGDVTEEVLAEDIGIEGVDPQVGSPVGGDEVLVLGWGVYRAAKSIDLGDTEPAQDSTAEE